MEEWKAKGELLQELDNLRSRIARLEKAEQKGMEGSEEGIRTREAFCSGRSWCFNPGASYVLGCGPGGSVRRREYRGWKLRSCEFDLSCRPGW